MQKAEESKRKIESKSIEWLRVAESRYEKKVESRSKIRLEKVTQKADRKTEKKQNREVKTRLEKVESP